MNGREREVLQALARGPKQGKEIMESFKGSRATLTRTLAKMVSGGWIERSDGWRYGLTAKGRELLNLLVQPVSKT